MTRSLSPIIRTRRWHRLLMWVIGLQMVIWAISGSYFALMNIHFIHGDHLVAPPSRPLSAESYRVTFSELRARYPDATGFSLTRIADQPVIQMTIQGQQRLLDPQSGAPLPPVSESLARRIGQQAYLGSGSLSAATLLTDTAPSELSPRHLPAWRLDYDDLGQTSLYISQLSGELVTKRHRYWRWFDRLWYLHILDYDDGEDLNNLLLRTAAWLALAGTLSGALLLWFRLRRRS
ncbi:hypothetical protein [Ferrimonas balearica]|uniref:hypothetical protein n=1 Tax=Ferrimonas balearica TaxID=44012 RepID=UPI001F1BAF59|nr:hypothetical protein [Ferrimonas balearica]MBY6019411.1 hypothetical protein [Halomonas denitrificans]MBY6096238.1 hypothetical protein [Ferrimonas balearica]